MILVLRKAVARRHGQTMVEYVLLMTAISLSCLLALHNYGEEIGSILRTSQARIAAVHLNLGRHDRRAPAHGAAELPAADEDATQPEGSPQDGSSRTEGALPRKSDPASPFGRMRTHAGVGALRAGGALWARFAACDRCPREQQP
jgi:Flp pilus assembly pilin Flp